MGAVFMLSNASKPFGGRALIDRLRHLTENVPWVLGPRPY